MPATTYKRRNRNSVFYDQVARGILVDFNEQGEPLVDFPKNIAGGPIPAISTVVLQHDFNGREVVLSFEDADRSRPIIIGLVQPPLRPQGKPGGPQTPERLELSADQEIVLHCGKASITLTAAGKVLVRGAYLLSRSSGVNRIKGGSVQIN